MAAADWLPLARPPAHVRSLADRVLAPAPLAAGRGLGPGVGRAPDRGGRRRPARLGPPRRRQHRGPGAPARCRSQKGGGDQALGRSRGGWGTKVHLRAERGGKPVCWVLTPGQRQEATQVAALLGRGAVARRHGAPRVRPDRVAGDKGYTGRTIRRYLRGRGIGAVIPRLRNEPRRGVRFDRAAYRERNAVERAIRRLKHFRAVATRYEKLAESYHALLTLAAIMLWLPV